MASSLRIFERPNRPLAYIEAPVTPRSWVINGYGRAEFTTSLPYLTEKFGPREETILKYNNLVFIEHIPSKNADGSKNGKLPDWVGILLPDRIWPDGKILSDTAYSAEAILTFRPMPLQPIKGTPKQMFLEMLGYANSIAGNDIVIQPGIVEDRPGQFADNLVGSAYDHICKLCLNAGMNWDVTAEVNTSGTLQLYANLYRRKGYDTNISLRVSDNAENSGPLLTEQGTPYNVIYGYSQASTKESRYFAVGRNEASIAKYGILAANKIFSGITDQTALQNAAQTLADAGGEPRKKLHRVALDVGSTFGSLATGNSLMVEDNDAGFRPGGGFGFSARAFILSLDYNDLSNKCPLNLEIA